jgi:hypothetical protein
MAKKQTVISEKEKEQQRSVIPFDLAKEFVNNLNVLLADDPLFKKWEINKSSTALKGTKLSLQFTLKQTEIEKIIDGLDAAQKKIFAFADPDEDEDD